MCPIFHLAGSPPQPVVPTHKDKGGAPPVRSIYDEVASPGLGSTPLTSRRPVSDLADIYCTMVTEIVM